jgi:hypothetical protein
MNDKSLSEWFSTEDETEKALLSAIEQTRAEYEKAPRQDYQNRRTAYAEALRALSKYMATRGCVGRF